jgi:hypothetical protein
MVTTRSGSTNFGAFLDALHGGPTAEIKAQVLRALAAGPRSILEIQEQLTAAPATVQDALQLAIEEGLVEIYLEDSRSYARLVKPPSGR